MGSLENNKFASWWKLAPKKQKRCSKVALSPSLSLSSAHSSCTLCQTDSSLLWQFYSCNFAASKFYLTNPTSTTVMLIIVYLPPFNLIFKKNSQEEYKPGMLQYFCFLTNLLLHSMFVYIYITDHNDNLDTLIGYQVTSYKL